MEKLIDLYARLLIRVGLNVQKGQTVVISSPVDCAPFARLCAAEAYNAQCREVIMNWSDDFVMREKYLYADDSVFDSFHKWSADFYNSMAEEGAAWLAIHAADPGALAGTDPERIRRASQSSGKALQPFQDRQTANFFPWCVASVPTAAWAKRVYPDYSEDEAVRLLWHSILNAVRVFENGDPIYEWKVHNGKLSQRVRKLNSFRFKSLHYSNSLGTDLTVELPDSHIWVGGQEKTQTGTPFNANIPTEEVFTAPKRGGVNGVVFASKPLCINGDIVSDFSFVFENGKIIGAKAGKGQKVLENAISVDDGSSYLGEVALVPFDSPISNSKLMFYNTLFDENASCHLAFGDSYPCVEGGEKMSKKELEEAGLNSSVTHGDFMIGTPDLTIIGTTHDNKKIPVFINGDFAF